MEFKKRLINWFSYRKNYHPKKTFPSYWTDGRGCFTSLTMTFHKSRFVSIFILDRKLLFLYVHPTGRLIANGVLNRLVPAKTHVDLQGSNKCTRRLGRGTEKALQRTLSKVNSGGSPHLFDCISLQNKTSHNSASQTSLTTFTYWIREGLAWLTKHLRGLAEKMKCIIKTWEGGRAEDFYAN